jgi:hypothetical protein
MHKQITAVLGAAAALIAIGCVPAAAAQPNLAMSALSTATAPAQSSALPTVGAATAADESANGVQLVRYYHHRYYRHYGRAYFWPYARVYRHHHRYRHWWYRHHYHHRHHYYRHYW